MIVVVVVVVVVVVLFSSVCLHESMEPFGDSFADSRKHVRRCAFVNACVRVLLYIPQRGVQWKQGVVIYMMLYTSLLHNTTPIHCTPLRLHPPLMNTQLPSKLLLPLNLTSIITIKLVISIVIVIQIVILPLILPLIVRWNFIPSSYTLRSFESKFRKHCTKKLDGALRKSTL